MKFRGTIYFLTTCIALSLALGTGCSSAKNQQTAKTGNLPVGAATPQAEGQRQAALEAQAVSNMKEAKQHMADSAAPHQ